MNVHKSIEFDQQIILRSIMALNNLTYFCCDLTYGNGSFYKDLPEPHIKLDIDPQSTGVYESCSTKTGLPDSCLNSLVFDPPFLTYVKKGRDHNSVMSKRFGGYYRYDELETHYRNTITEAYRILKLKGLFIFKCQDIVHNHKLHCTHANVINRSEGRFRLKDLFVLAAKTRMPSPNRKGVQKHSRIFHSYFLVLERLK